MRKRLADTEMFAMALDSTVIATEEGWPAIA